MIPDPADLFCPDTTRVDGKETAGFLCKSRLAIQRPDSIESGEKKENLAEQI
ncbi:MAG: hypothetical protein JXA44_10090 [Methanospirillaceae archaeon]|nr:hypothetical protein [Methanospirillaceae archaeon]